MKITFQGKIATATSSSFTFGHMIISRGYFTISHRVEMVNDNSIAYTNRDFLPNLNTKRRKNNLLWVKV